MCDVNHILFICQEIKEKQEDLYKTLIDMEIPLPTCSFLVLNIEEVLVKVANIVVEIEKKGLFV